MHVHLLLLNYYCYAGAATTGPNGLPVLAAATLSTQLLYESFAPPYLRFASTWDAAQNSGGSGGALVTFTSTTTLFPNTSHAGVAQPWAARTPAGFGGGRKALDGILDTARPPGA